MLALPLLHWHVVNIIFTFTWRAAFIPNLRNNHAKPAGRRAHLAEAANWSGITAGWMYVKLYNKLAYQHGFGVSTARNHFMRLNEKKRWMILSEARSIPFRRALQYL
ncbi:hypothetical protein KCP77_00135 [Salmonella enterica subsp. enterica]|nr:hypothetical protein KCP77_00135 [Salmonella enterica subsp. enterica]